jgi:AraC-like DNA-binding protein
MIPESVLLINKESSDAPSMARATTITHEQALQFRNQLESFFESHKPFLKPGYKVKQLSEDLDIPFYQLSAFINQEYGQNFNELINQFRVKHLETMVKQSPEFAGYTLEALGKLAGFNSRSTFIAAVKKNTGKTPQEFFGPIFAG